MVVERTSSAYLSGLTARQAAVSSAALAVVVSLGWVFTVRQAEGMDGAMAGTMGLALGAFLVMWLPMVLAMMFPAVGSSAVTAVRGDQDEVRAGAVTVRATGFLLAYLVVWMLFGLAVYLVLAAAAELISIPPENAKWLAAGTYAVAGLYQFTPVKDRCRAICQRARCADLDNATLAGRFGQLARAGVTHGLYCIGCCAGFTVVLIAVGMANLLAMALLTVVIFAERYLVRQGVTVSRVAGALLLLAAVLTPFVAWLHPGLPGPDTGETPMMM